MPQEEIKILSRSLVDNLVAIRQEFAESADLTIREFKITNSNAAILSLEGMVNKETISHSILNPIVGAPILETDPAEKLVFIRDHVLSTAEQVQLVDLDSVIMRLMVGFAVLAIDGCDFMLAFGVQGFAYRSVSEPNNEVMQRGSREGFVEPIQINTAMIRRRLRTPDLKFERLVVGSVSQTPVYLCYLGSVVSPEILRNIRENIQKVNLKSVLASGYLAPFLEKKSIFNGVGYSQRPDTVCGKIMEGRVAIMVDGTPNVLIIPHLFVENFQTLDDYANRPFYATFIRWLKIFAFFLAVFLPGIYVAAVTFHPEIIPEALLLKITDAESSTPFPVMEEAIIIHIVYEIMREAGLRVPKPLGHAVSIVGALVIGETAVSSGLIGAPTLMAIALTAISSYVVPSLYEQVALLRLVFLLAGGMLGLWAVMLGGAFVLINICDESVYKVPFTAPLSPFRLRSMRDVLLRMGWRTLSKHNETVQNMPGSNIKNR